MCIRDRDIGVAHHELLEDSVLDRTGELVEGAALLQTRDDVERQALFCSLLTVNIWDLTAVNGRG